MCIFISEIYTYKQKVVKIHFKIFLVSELNINELQLD